MWGMTCTVEPRYSPRRSLFSTFQYTLPVVRLEILVQVFVDEALIVAQVQIGLRAVLGDVDLAVLIGAHGAGVDVDVGVQLLGGDLQSPRLEKTAKRRRGDALAQTGNHAAGHKDVFRHW